MERCRRYRLGKVDWWRREEELKMQRVDGRCPASREHMRYVLLKLEAWKTAGMKSYISKAKDFDESSTQLLTSPIADRLCLDATPSEVVPYP
jgi:uncharacterized protein YbcC (UPF0753/DUF2309 family)